MIKADVLENGEVLIYEKTVSDSVRFETVRFTFPESWKGLNKTAVFKNGDRAIGIILNTNSIYCVGENECFIPHEVIHSPKFTVSVFGVNNEKRATTARGEVFVIESGFETGDIPAEPTENEYSQILTVANEAKALAQSVRDDLDSGNYSGPKGDKGDKGDTGAAGVYYGTEPPDDPSHPIWINPNGTADE